MSKNVRKLGLPCLKAAGNDQHALSVCFCLQSLCLPKTFKKRLWKLNFQVEVSSNFGLHLLIFPRCFGGSGFGKHLLVSHLDFWIGDSINPGDFFRLKPGRSLLFLIFGSIFKWHGSLAPTGRHLWGDDDLAGAAALPSD